MQSIKLIILFMFGTRYTDCTIYVRTFRASTLSKVNSTKIRQGKFFRSLSENISSLATKMFDFCAGVISKDVGNRFSHCTLRSQITPHTANYTCCVHRPIFSSFCLVKGDFTISQSPYLY